MMKRIGLHRQKALNLCLQTNYFQKNVYWESTESMHIVHFMQSGRHQVILLHDYLLALNNAEVSKPGAKTKSDHHMIQLLLLFF